MGGLWLTGVIASGRRGRYYVQVTQRWDYDRQTSCCWGGERSDYGRNPYHTMGVGED